MRDGGTMLFMTLLFLVVCLSILFFLMMRYFNQALAKYEMHFKGLAQHNLSDVFIFLDPVQVWGAAVFLCFSCVTAVWLVFANVMIALAVGAVLLFLPPFVFNRLKQKRRKKFNEQLPLLLSGLASALKAGTGIQIALKTVIEETTAPLSQEFGMVLREQRLGLSFEEALDNLLQRMPTEATQLVVSSLKIAVQTGGSISEVLERVASTLRAIKQIEDKIEALTSQGKFQAKVMVLLPIILMFVLNFGDFNVLTLLWTTQSGAIVLGIIAVLEGCGIYFIHKIVKIDI